MSYSPPDPLFAANPDIDAEDGRPYLLSTGEAGFMGKTLFPDKEGKENSPNSHIVVVVNKNLSPAGAAETYSHEANGHAFRYIETKFNHHEASHHNCEGMLDNNDELKKLIVISSKETRRNML